MNEIINWSDFEKIDIRIGQIISAEIFKEARKPAYKLKIDFGGDIIKNSSAQITDLYTPESLIGKQVVCVINFPVKQIANFFSECLVLGSINDKGVVTLLTTDKPVENGLKIG